MTQKAFGPPWVNKHSDHHEWTSTPGACVNNHSDHHDCARERPFVEPKVPKPNCSLPLPRLPKSDYAQWTMSKLFWQLTEFTLDKFNVSCLACLRANIYFFQPWGEEKSKTVLICLQTRLKICPSWRTVRQLLPVTRTVLTERFHPTAYERKVSGVPRKTDDCFRSRSLGFITKIAILPNDYHH